MSNKEECASWYNNYLKKNVLKKSKDYSQQHLKRTNHNLSFANWLMHKHQEEIPATFGNDNFYDWCINSYYYAIYHAVLALMSKNGYNSKNHSATLAYLILQHYHKKQTLERDDVEIIANTIQQEDIETLGVSKELREKACYDIHEHFEQQLAQQAQQQAITLINKIKHLLVSA